MDKEKLKKNFERHGFHVSFFESEKEVRDYVKSLASGSSVGIGGSMTVEQCGIYDELVKVSDVCWHWKDKSPDVLKNAANADFYILSANGVSESGELVNIDGSGNRVSASLYGPRHVIYIIGENKIEPDLSSAIYRARNVAAVKNAERLSRNTPCVKEGHCFDCSSMECICNGSVTVSHPMNGQTVELLFVEKPLGF